MLAALALVQAALWLAPSPRGPAARGQGQPAKENWSLQHEEITNHPEAELLVRHGSIDNLTYGWPRGFDPFSGAATPIHPFPWKLNPRAAQGTDRIMVGSSYRGRPPTGQIDGYTGTTRRPANNPVPIPITFTPPRFPIRAAILQVFVDDFQSPVWKSKFQVTMNGKRVREMEDILNALDQSGPIGKLVTLQLPREIVDTLGTGKLTIFVDDPTTGAGDGYAFDFFRLLINPRGPRYQGVLVGRVTSARDGKPISTATVSAGGVVETRTDANGNYELRGVPAGHASVVASALGYRRKTTLTDLLAGKTVRVDVVLEKVTLGPDIIEASQEGLIGPAPKKFPPNPRTATEPPPTEVDILPTPGGEPIPAEAVVPPKTAKEASPDVGKLPTEPAEKPAPTRDRAQDEGEDESDGFAWPVLIGAAGGLLVLVLLLVLANGHLGGLVTAKQRCVKCARIVKVRAAAAGKRFRCPVCGTVQAVSA
jgi:hypothetical protein